MRTRKLNKEEKEKNLFLCITYLKIMFEKEIATTKKLQKKKRKRKEGRN